MKITPLEVQHPQFRVGFRGFDIAEVDNFLALAANEFEELLQENNRLKEEDQKKTEKIRELEAAARELGNALISAQKIREEMKANARKEGDLIIEEAKANARKILETAQTRAMQVEIEIARVKLQRAEFEATLRSILEMHMKLVDTPPGDQMSPADPEAK